MKKIKVLIFIAALIFGIAIAKVFAFSFGFSLPTISIFSCEKGSGVAKTENRDLTGFNEIEVSGNLEIEVTAQKDFSVTVEGDDNLLQYIETEISGDTLKIYTNKRTSPLSKTRIMISMPELNGLDTSGASKVFASNLVGDSLKIDVSGASKIEVGGQVNDLNIEASGASKINADSLKTANANIDVSGASHISVFVTEELKAEASGASKISYSGEPKNVFEDTSGASSVRRK